MIIEVDEKTIKIEEEIFHEASQRSFIDIEKLYMNLDIKYKLGIKTIVRTWIFPYLEKVLNTPIRPPKEVDPVLFLLSHFLVFLENLAKDVDIKIKTVKSDGSTYCPTAIAVTIKNQSEGGRQLAFNWEKGKR